MDADAFPDEEKIGDVDHAAPNPDEEVKATLMGNKTN